MKLFFSFVLLVLLSGAGQSAEATDYAFCWGEKDSQRICQPAMVMDSQYPQTCRNFAIEVGASYYGYRYSSDLELLETSMGQHCDSVRDGGEGGIFACLMDIYCPEEGGSRTRHLASRVYAIVVQKSNLEAVAL